jgi:3-oxoacyl-[acyl-carrier protein] reductase
MVKHASKVMLKQKSGTIINMSSVIGLVGNAGQANYAAAKAGIIGITKSAAKELAARGITCNAIAPGFIETDMTAVLSDKVKEGILANIPLKRMGSPEEIANTAVFLASSPYITGQVIAVDGGMVM